MACWDWCTELHRAWFSIYPFEMLFFCLVTAVRFSRIPGRTHSTVASCAIWRSELDPFDSSGYFSRLRSSVCIFNEKRSEISLATSFLSNLYPIISNANSTTQAMHLLSEAIPLAAASGLEYNDIFLVMSYDGKWDITHALSPENVLSWVKFLRYRCLLTTQSFHSFWTTRITQTTTGTGTAITMAAVAQSVGIPIRVAGCSQAYSMMIIIGLNFMMIKARWSLEIRGIRRRVCRKEMKVVRGTHQVRVILGYAAGQYHFITDRYTHEHMKNILYADPTGLNSIWVSQWSRTWRTTSMGSICKAYLAQRIFRIWFQSLWCLLQHGMWFESDWALQSKWVLG